MFAKCVRLKKAWERDTVDPLHARILVTRKKNSVYGYTHFHVACTLLNSEAYDLVSLQNKTEV